MAPQDSSLSAQSENSEVDSTETESGNEVQTETSATSGTDTASRFIGQWKKLVSTTNWEKGRIICQWRDALMEEGAAVTEYSDEAWAQLVGGVTSQHVGRLRRVHQRFGEVFTQYSQLFWSHFQAALDWDDAEMWLEGSIQNSWSVSQMRGKRWETHGTTPEEQKQETDLDNTEMDATGEAPEGDDPADSGETVAAATPSTATLDSSDEKPAKSSETEDKADDSTKAEAESTESEALPPVEKRTRLSVDVESLPDDLAEAFESFKLAIIAHRREGWRDTSVESVVECLDSLRQLALESEEA